ncbi:acyloxyacyl hydrolase [Cesiribacter andamanensis]|uniref:acyloxyacyl hydrolase n=1 Tax=Cesiribacter andamanensis TaxID=649507 RepID=UPI001F28E48C|nr:acyloxyacyl hydrolase [Cesiribacter andamanensis]
MYAQQQQQQQSNIAEPAALQLGLTTHYGFIIPHSSTIRDVAHSNPRALELDLSLHFTSQKAWNYLQGYPRLGATFSYVNFNYPRVLGNAYALVLYAEPFLSAHRRFSLSFRLGGGLAYMDTPYDEAQNPDNLFYSTRFSFPLVANLMGNYRLGERLQLRAGGTYNHISNGGRRQPNKGINYPTVTLGLQWALRPASFPERQPATAQAQGKKREYLLALIGGYKDREDDPGRQLPVLGLAAYASQRLGRLSALTFGLEWIADYTIRHQLEQQGVDTDFQRGALLLGHELRIGRIRLGQQLGVYVYAPHKAREAVYQRWGLEYHSQKRLFGGINLKAHRHVADFLDLRLGLKF